MTDLSELKGATVECATKPVCYRCAIVLGLLGVEPYDKDTKKGISGAGVWVMADSDFRTKFIEKYGDIAKYCQNFSNCNEVR